MMMAFERKLPRRGPPLTVRLVQKTLTVTAANPKLENSSSIVRVAECWLAQAREASKLALIVMSLGAKPSRAS